MPVCDVAKRRAITLGDRVRARRKELGLSQEAVAEAAGMKNYQALARIERGKGENPTLATLRHLAAALQWSVAELIGESGG